MKTLILLAVLSIVACRAAAAQSPSSEITAVEETFQAMKAPVAPRHLIGNIYYVGSIGVSSFLITTPEGHFLLDTGFEDTVPQLEKNIGQLGFKPRDIKIILSSHAHVDHVGGHAAMKTITGAKIYCSAEDAKTLETGGLGDFIPLPRETILFPSTKADHLVRDGEHVSLGHVVLTAHLTPGHTRGATTWKMEVTEGGKLYHVVFFSSTTINAGTKLLDHPAYPAIVADYTRTFAKLKALPCDIFLAPHANQFAMTTKFEQLDRGATPNPLIDPTELGRSSLERKKPSSCSSKKKKGSQAFPNAP